MRITSKIVLASILGAVISLIAYPLLAVIGKGKTAQAAVIQTTWGKIKQMYLDDPPPPPPPPPPPKE